MVLFVIGAIPDNFLQSIAAALMIASTAWIATAARRRGAPEPTAGAGDAGPAGSRPEVRPGRPARVRLTATDRDATCQAAWRWRAHPMPGRHRHRGETVSCPRIVTGFRRPPTAAPGPAPDAWPRTW